MLNMPKLPTKAGLAYVNEACKSSGCILRCSVSHVGTYTSSRRGGTETAQYLTLPRVKL